MTFRKALLINAQGPASHHSVLPTELEATRNFLCSPNGGAWEEGEIMVLHHPTLREICQIVKEMEADYTITYFFGKGFPDEQGNHFLLVGESDFIQDTELLNTSQKQVVLIDEACGTFTNDDFAFESSEADLARSRAMYDRWIESCEDGQLIMHATEQSTVSQSPDRAGLFTKKLLQVAKTIPPVVDRFNLKSILTTGHETPDLLLEEGFEEGPAITWSKGNVKLPFALALPMPVSLQPRVRNSNDFTSGMNLGLFLIAFLLSLD